MSSEKHHRIIGHLNIQWTLSVLNPASSFLRDINDYKVTPGCRVPLSPAQSEDLVPEPEAGHGGGAAWDHEGDKHTLVVGGDTQTDLERWREWDIIYNTVPCRDHPCRGRPISRARD